MIYAIYDFKTIEITNQMMTDDMFVINVKLVVIGVQSLDYTWRANLASHVSCFLALIECEVSSSHHHACLTTVTIVHQNRGNKAT